MGWEAGLRLLHWAGGHCRLLAAALSPLSPARAWSLGCKFPGSNTTSSAIPCHVRAQQQSKALNFEWLWVYTISRGARLIGCSECCPPSPARPYKGSMSIRQPGRCCCPSPAKGCARLVSIKKWSQCLGYGDLSHGDLPASFKTDSFQLACQQLTVLNCSNSFCRTWQSNRSSWPLSSALRPWGICSVLLASCTQSLWVGAGGTAGQDEGHYGPKAYQAAAFMSRVGNSCCICISANGNTWDWLAPWGWLGGQSSLCCFVKGWDFIIQMGRFQVLSVGIEIFPLLNVYLFYYYFIIKNIFYYYYSILLPLLIASLILPFVELMRDGKQDRLG